MLTAVRTGARGPAGSRFTSQSPTQEDSVHLTVDVSYRQASGAIRWEGRVIEDEMEFAAYMRDVVGKRMMEDDLNLSATLRGLADTKVATAHIEGMLNGVSPAKPEDIGEALAECLLRDQMGWEVHWPWKTARDRRNPNASLAGPDLVGFCLRDSETLLLFGEVKTSRQHRNPPAVMTGTHGLPSQLARLVRRDDKHWALLSWLVHRCQSDQQRSRFQAAVRRFLESGGQDCMLVGMLMRDTAPDKRDLHGPARALSKSLATVVATTDLFAWYLPVSINRWPALVRPST